MGSMAVISDESRRTEPLLGSSSLLRHLSREVLPAPEGPTIADTACLWNDASIRLRTGRPPRSSETPWSSIAVDPGRSSCIHRAYGAGTPPEWLAQLGRMLRRCKFW